MSIEEAIMGGIVFKGKKDKPKEEEKVKTKAKKATYIRGYKDHKYFFNITINFTLSVNRSNP